MKTYKGIVTFTYIQEIEVEAATEEEAFDLICEKYDRSKAVEDEVLIAVLSSAND